MEDGSKKVSAGGRREQSEEVEEEGVKERK